MRIFGFQANQGIFKRSKGYFKAKAEAKAKAKAEAEAKAKTEAEAKAKAEAEAKAKAEAEAKGLKVAGNDWQLSYITNKNQFEVAFAKQNVLESKKQKLLEALQKIEAELSHTSKTAKIAKANVESLLAYQTHVDTDIAEAEIARNHERIVEILRYKHLHQTPTLQNKAIVAIKNLLCSAKSKELGILANDVSAVAIDMTCRKWATHASISDSVKKNILTVSDWVVGVANIVEEAQVAQNSANGQKLDTKFDLAMEQILQTVVIDSKPAPEHVQQAYKFIEWSKKYGYSDFLAKMFELGIFGFDELSVQSKVCIDFIAKSLGFEPAQKFKDNIKFAVTTQVSSTPNSAQAVVVLQKDQVSLGPKIGEGSFGVVHKGSTTLGSHQTSEK